MTTKIILDCDPGIDDAMAIGYGVGSPEIDLAGITTVAGNVSLDKTTANALRLLSFFGAGHVPVTAGAAAPLTRPAITAEHVHGADGLRGLQLPPPAGQPRPGHAADYLADTIMAAPGEITLVTVGPLTNVALALRREPALVSAARDFVIMGGSTTRGNVTPAAEFNIAADPEAAAAVFSAGWTVTMVGLDVTLRAIATTSVLERLSGLGRIAQQLLLPGLRRFDDDLEHAGSAEPAVHDVCAVAYVAHPELLGCVPARVEVETEGRWTAGMTVTDFRAPPDTWNTRVATTIDVPAIWETVHEAYARIAAAL
jgi:purine nucleosidase